MLKKSINHTKSINSNSTNIPVIVEKEIILPNGNYLLVSLANVEINDGKPILHNLVGCYHSSDGEQYAIDTTGNSAGLLPLFTDKIPKLVDALVSKEGLPKEE